MSPNAAAMGIAAAWTVTLGTLAWYVFGRLDVRLADYI